MIRIVGVFALAVADVKHARHGMTTRADHPTSKQFGEKYEGRLRKGLGEEQDQRVPRQKLRIYRRPRVRAFAATRRRRKAVIPASAC